MKSLKDFVAKKSLSSDTLSKIGSKTRFCSTHANEKGEVKPLPFRLVIRDKKQDLNGWGVAL